VAAGKLVAGIELYSAGARLVLMTLKPVPTVVHCEEIPLQIGDEGRLGAIVAKSLHKFEAPRADVNLVFTPPLPAPGRHHLFHGPKMRKSELAQVSVRELRREGSLDPEKAYLTVDALDSVESDAEAKTEAAKAGQRYLIVALSREPVDVAVMGLLEAKLVVRSATTSVMGILRALSTMDLPKQGCVAVCHLDAKRSAMVVIDNGVPRFFRDIPTTFARGGREGGDDSLIAQALAREIDISLVFFAQQNRPKHVDTIVVVGDTEIADRVVEWLGDNQAYNILRFGASPKLLALPNAPANLLPYAAAIGASLASRKGPFSGDLLPSELRGRPERVVSIALGACLLIVLMGFVMNARVRAARITDEREQLRVARETEYRLLEPKVEKARKIDEAAVQADRWGAFFETLQLYHRRYGNIMSGLESALPARGVFSEVSVKDAGSPRPPPLQGKLDANLVMSVIGHVTAADLPAAQADVLTTFHALETMKSVQTAALNPLRDASSTPAGLRLPFTMTLSIANAFPGQKR
jgi:hypothetical protein